MPQSQPVNSSQVDGLSSQFQRRWEPIYQWRSMCSMLLGMPGLRAAWPMSVVDFQRPECTDISGHGYDLQSANALGDVAFAYGPAPTMPPAARFQGGANQYLVRASALANWATITGTEASIWANAQGMSIGGWFWWTALPGALEHMMAKVDGVTPQYRLYLTAGNLLQWQVWAGPVAVTSAATINTGWNHCVGLFDPANQDLHVVLNGVVTSNLGAAPAAIVDTALDFVIGADSNGANRLTGYASDCVLSAAFLSLGFVKALYHYTKAAYGVK